MLPDDTRLITDEASLRAPYPQPMFRATGKVLRALDKYCRRIISLSPFCVVATQGPNGADVSPCGDFPSFVRVLTISRAVGNVEGRRYRARLGEIRFWSEIALL